MTPRNNSLESQENLFAATSAATSGPVDSNHSQDLTEQQPEKAITPSGLKALNAQDPSGETAERLAQIVRLTNQTAKDNAALGRNPSHTLATADSVVSQAPVRAASYLSTVDQIKEVIGKTLAEINFNALLLRAGFYEIFATDFSQIEANSTVSSYQVELTVNKIIVAAEPALSQIVENKPRPGAVMASLEKKLKEVALEAIEHEFNKNGITIKYPEGSSAAYAQVAVISKPDDQEGRRYIDRRNDPSHQTDGHINIATNQTPVPQTLSQEIGIASHDLRIIEKWGVDTMVQQEFFSMDIAADDEERRQRAENWFEIVLDEKDQKLSSQEREELYLALCSIFKVDGETVKVNDPQYRSEQNRSEQNFPADDSGEIYPEHQQLLSPENHQILAECGMISTVIQQLGRHQSNLPFKFNGREVSPRELIKNLCNQGADHIYVSAGLRKSTGQPVQKDPLLREKKLEIYNCLISAFGLNQFEVPFSYVDNSHQSLDSAPAAQDPDRLDARYDSQMLPAIGHLPTGSLPEIPDEDEDTGINLIPTLGKVQSDLPDPTPLSKYLSVSDDQVATYIEEKFKKHLSGITIAPSDWTEVIVMILDDIIADAHRDNPTIDVNDLRVNEFGQLLAIYLTSRLGPDNQEIHEAETSIPEYNFLLEQLPLFANDIAQISFIDGEISKNQIYDILCSAVNEYRDTTENADELGNGLSTDSVIGDFVNLIINHHNLAATNVEARRQLLEIASNPRLIMAEATGRDSLEALFETYGQENPKHWQDTLTQIARQLTDFESKLDSGQEDEIQMSLVRLIEYTGYLFETSEIEFSDEMEELYSTFNSRSLLDSALEINKNHQSPTGMSRLRQYSPWIAGILLLLASITELGTGMVSKVFRPNDGRSTTSGPKIAGTDGMKASVLQPNQRPTQIHVRPSTVKAVLPKQTFSTPSPHPEPRNAAPQASSPPKLAATIPVPSSPRIKPPTKEQLKQKFLSTVPEPKLQLLIKDGVVVATNNGEGIVAHIQEIYEMLEPRLKKYSSDSEITNAQNEYIQELAKLGRDWHRQWQLKKGSLPVERPDFVNDPSNPTRHQQMNTDLAALNKGFSHDGKTSGWAGPNHIKRDQPINLGGATASLPGKLMTLVKLFEEREIKSIAATSPSTPSPKKGAAIDTDQQVLKYAGNYQTPDTIEINKFVSSIADQVNAQYALFQATPGPTSIVSNEDYFPAVIPATDTPQPTWDTTKSVFDHESERSQITDFDNLITIGNLEVSNQDLEKYGSKKAIERIIQLECESIAQIDKVTELFKSMPAESISIQKIGDSSILSLNPEDRANLYGIFKPNTENFQPEYLTKDLYL